MSSSSYPALLNKRARIFASLNRSDLLVLGISYLALTRIGLSGVKILLSSIVILFINKVIVSRLQKNFIKGISRTRVIDWSGAIGRLK